MAEGFMAKIGTDIDEIHCLPVFCQFLAGLYFPVRQIESEQSLSQVGAQSQLSPCCQSRPA